MFGRGFCTLLMVLASMRVEKVSGVSIRSCNADHTISVEENTKDFIFSAEFNKHMNVEWLHTDYNDNETKLIAQCYVENSSCVSALSYSPIMALLNAYTLRSQIVIPDIVRGRFPDGVWTFRAGSNEANCTMDVIYPAKDAQCEVTINLIMNKASGVCNVSRLYSSNGKYSCAWMEQIDAENEVIVPESQTTFSRQNLSATEVANYSAVCSFNKSLPLASTFRYRAVISPGNVSPPIAYRYVGTADPTSAAISVTSTTATSLTTTPSGKVGTADPTSAAISVTSTTATSLTTTPSGKGTTTESLKVGDVSTARYEGIGIGVAIAVAFVTFVMLIVAVLWRCRGRRADDKETEWVGRSFDSLYTLEMARCEERERSETNTSPTEPYDSAYSSIAEAEEAAAAACTITPSKGSTTCRKVPRSAGGLCQDTNPTQQNTGVYETPIPTPPRAAKTDEPEENPYNSRISRDVINPYPSDFHFAPFARDVCTESKPAPSDCEYVGVTLQNQENEQTDTARREAGGDRPKTEERQANKGAEYLYMSMRFQDA